MRNDELEQMNGGNGKASAPPRLRGCIERIAVIVAPADRAGKPVSIGEAWLPLHGDKVESNSWTDYREPGLIPVLKANVYHRISPMLDRMALDNDWLIQYVKLSYRPGIFDEAFGENSYLRLSSPEIRDLPLHLTPIFDVSPGKSRVGLYEDAFSVLYGITEKSGVPMPALAKVAHDNKVLGKKTNRVSPAAALQALLTPYPFLIHHLFRVLPSLHVFDCQGLITDRMDGVSFIRYDKEWVKHYDPAIGFQKERLIVEP